MPYAATPPEDISSALRRIAGEQAARGLASLDAALDHEASGDDQIDDRDIDDRDIDDRDEDAWDSGVHDARKRCKKIRAVARICRDSLGEDYDDINAAFRDSARLMSDARDARALIQTVDLVVKSDLVTDLVPSHRLSASRAALLQRYARVRRDARRSDVVARARAAMSTAADGIAAWPLPDSLSGEDLRPSIERTYARGHRLWAEAQETLGEQPHASTELWHTWRKRAKYLWYHIRIVEPAWPPVLGGWESELDVLCDDLGEDHDLAVLIDVLREGVALDPGGSEEVLDPGAREQLIGALNARRQEVRRQIAPRAALLYADDPGVFAGRLARLVDMGPLSSDI